MSTVGLDGNDTIESLSAPKADEEKAWPSPVVASSVKEIQKDEIIKPNRHDPIAIERCNLLTVCKLVIKSLIDASLKQGRMIDDENEYLQQFFIILEHILRHGLIVKKSILRDKRDIWNVLEEVEKCAADALDITVSVRDLPAIKSSLGRSRAWLRLAIMQKRLADYFCVLVEKKDEILLEYYSESAFMMGEEGMILSGLLVGLNVIDCSFSIKDQDLDQPIGVIDYSVYIKVPLSSPSTEEKDSEDNNMAAILDQKNYLEELNRHLNSSVNNLQQKVASLQTSNTILKEDLAIAKNSVLELQQENISLSICREEILQQHSKQLEATKEDLEIERETYITSREGLDTLYQDLQSKLKEETQIRMEVERELELQIGLKQEMEVALRLLEKDIHEKQDTMVSLRKQVEDIKSMNLEMHNKVQEKDTVLHHKADMLKRLEEKTNQMAETITDMERSLKQNQEEKKGMEEMTRKLGHQLGEKDSKRLALETDLKIEKEWRATLQHNLDQEKEKTHKYHNEMEGFKDMKKDYEHLQLQYGQMKKLCEEQETTLRELGGHLSQSKLKVEDLKEAQQVMKEAQWTSDKEATSCIQCTKAFSVSRRKHHCRNCGDIFCNECSDNKMPLPSSAKPVRVCDNCHEMLLQRYSAT